MCMFVYEMPKEDYKTFKEYYADPEFKARHLEKMRHKVPCPLCECVVSKGNMKKHQDTKKCQRNKNAKT